MNEIDNFREIMEMISNFGTINFDAGMENNYKKRAELHKQSFEKYCAIMQLVSAACCQRRNAA